MDCCRWHLRAEGGGRDILHMCGVGWQQHTHGGAWQTCGAAFVGEEGRGGVLHVCGRGGEAGGSGRLNPLWGHGAD